MARGFGAAESTFGKARVRPSEIQGFLNDKKSMSVDEATKAFAPLGKYLSSEGFKREWEEHLGDLDGGLQGEAENTDEGSFEYEPDPMYVEKGGIVWEISHAPLAGTVTLNESPRFGSHDNSSEGEFEWETDEAPKDFKDSVDNWTTVRAAGKLNDFVKEDGKIYHPLNSPQYKLYKSLFGYAGYSSEPNTRGKLNDVVKKIEAKRFYPIRPDNYRTGLSYFLNDDEKAKAMNRFNNGIPVDEFGKTQEEFEADKIKEVKYVKTVYERAVDYAKRYPKFIKGFKD